MVIQGAQVVSRVAQVLRVVSEHSDHGISTTEIARKTGLTRPTAHRLLTSLSAEGFVDFDGLLGRWLLGPELFFMGSVAAARYDIKQIAMPHVQAIARATGESAFLSARRGDETVCLLREEGTFPLRSFVLYEGVRFPLGVASAGMAILAFLPDDEIGTYVADHHLELEHGPAHATQLILDRVSKTRRNGWAVNPGLVLEGSWGMGAAVFDASDHPAWALSITGVETRFGPERIQTLGDLLLKHAHELGRQMKSPHA